MKIEDKLVRETLFRLKKLARHLNLNNRSKLKKKRDYIDTISANHSIEDISVCLFSHPHDSVCGRTLYDEEHCIFHSFSPGKKDDFYLSFAKELEEQLKNSISFNFAGFHFPKNFKFKYHNFQKSNFKGAFLFGADFWGCNLSNADLSNCYLERASLQEANLDGANLLNATLKRCNLRGANLISANLYGANLAEVNLSDANLIGAYFSTSSFQNANLTSISILNSEITHIPRDLCKEYLNTWTIIGGDYTVNIVRSIEFPPEYHQAGVAILNYFGTVLRQEYPDTRAKVNISQEGLKVTMTIETGQGDIRKVEEKLDEYGLVAIGKKAAEELFNDPFHAVLLKAELRNAENRVMQMREMQVMQNTQHGERIASLEKRLDAAEKREESLMEIINNGIKHSGKVLKYAKGFSKTVDKLTDSALGLRQDFINNLRYIIADSTSIKTELSLIMEKVTIDDPTDQDKQEIETAIEAIHEKTPGKILELREMIRDVGLGAAGSIWATVLLTAIDRLAS